MFKKILIATDNSPLMRNAIQYTANAFPYADFHLINVVNTSDGSIPQTPMIQKHLKDISKDALKKGRKILKQMGIEEVKLAMPEGVPSKEIMKYISEKDIDLIVMATHSKSGTQRVHIGDTALHSLQITHIPTLVFACTCEIEQPTKIFNPTTFSKYSVEGTMLALKMAKYHGADLTVYHFGEIDAEASVKKIQRMAKKEGVPLKLVRKPGASDEDILEQVGKYDLMVGSRGRGGILYKFRFIFPWLALSKLEKELIAESEIPFLLVGD